MTILKTGVQSDISFSMLATPRPGMSLAEGLDKWQELGNKVIDHGDEAQPVILTARGRSRRVRFEFIQELAVNVTFEQAMAHMRKVGYSDVKEGPLNGNIRTIEATEEYQ